VIAYPIVEQMSFDWMIALFFFLSGTSAGSFLFSMMANYWKKDYKPLATTAAWIAPIVLAIGMFIALIDLGKPSRLWRLYLYLNPTSMLSWGIWFLSIFFLITVAYLWLLKKDENKAKRLGYIGVLFALAAASYTAVLLAQAPARALWHSSMVPPLFVLGGLISGVALVILVSADKTDRALINRLGRGLGWLILLELGLIPIEVLTLLNGGADDVIAAKALLVGEYSFLFWVVEIALGAVIPAAIFLRAKASPRLQSAAAMLVLIGIFMMRYIIVMGGHM